MGIVLCLLVALLGFAAFTPAARAASITGFEQAEGKRVAPLRAASGFDGDFARGRWTLAFESAQTFSINNRNHYHIAPQLLTLHWRAFPVGRIGAWHSAFSPLVTVAVEPIIKGPEDLWFGGLVGFSYTVWKPGSRWALAFDARGGVGWIDASEVLDGQSNDLTFTAVGSLSVLYRWSDCVTVSGGIYYQHISNGGLSEPERPNKGLDAFGPGVGVRWSF